MSTAQPLDHTRARVVLGKMRRDIEADVQSFEGASFTGANVSKMFGNLSAVVDALCGIVDGLVAAAEASS